MPIELPEHRVYYHPSPNETYELRCWVPADQVEKLVDDGVLSPELGARHPRGFEFPVEETALEDAGIQLPSSPALLLTAFHYVRRLRKLPPTVEIRADVVEPAADRMGRVTDRVERDEVLRSDMLRIAPPRKLDVPRTEGDTVDSVFNRLLTARRGT